MYIVIAGGGKIGAYLATTLLSSGNYVAVIEEDVVTADRLSAALEGRYLVVCGDGSFQMSMYELGTIAVNRLPLKILVVQNEFLGLVREHQEKTYDGHYFGVQLYDYPRYDKIAEAYDMEYFSCNSNEDLDQVLDGFLACDRACIMVCRVDSANNTK